MAVPYIGSGPYCYANALAMVTDAQAPPPSAIEVLTGSPFGATFIAGLPYFSPAGWDPDIGLGPAIAALGWACDRTAGGEDGEAIARLREAVAAGPVLAGPVEFGLLRYIPGMGAPIGSDHFVVVVAVDDTMVTLHDPHGHPYATLPLDDFVAAWRAETVPYPATPFTMRAGFHRVRDVDVATALRSTVPDAVRWLDASGDAVERLADLVSDEAGLVGDEAGLVGDKAGLVGDDQAHGHLVHFAVRVGARRLADASFWLRTIGYDRASEIADGQARLLGALQYDLVTGDHPAAAAGLRRLAPTYAQLREMLTSPAGSTTPLAPTPTGRPAPPAPRPAPPATHRSPRAGA